MTFDFFPIDPKLRVPCDCSPEASPHDAQHFVSWIATGKLHANAVCDTGLGAALRKAYGPQEEKR